MQIVGSGAPLAHQVEHVLGARGLANPRGEQRGEGGYRSCARATREAFNALGTRFLQMPLGDVEPVRLGRARSPRERRP